MTNPKEPTTHIEQLELLKSRGLAINNCSFCLEKLSSINYYRLSAYLLPFKDSNDSYQNGTNFQQIYNIYEFDRHFRDLLFQAIEVIEISLRAKLSYHHAHTYGALGYLDPTNFGNRHKHDRFNKNIQQEIKRNRNMSFVKHHLKKYKGEFPIWVIVELFSFGMLSYFYSDLKTKDKKKIASEYLVNYKDLGSWLRCLTDLRNICAHYGRIYYRIFSASPASLSLSDGQKRRAWALLLILKQLYPSVNEWNNDYLPLLEELFTKYKDDINLYHLAMPKNWVQELYKNE